MLRAPMTSPAKSCCDLRRGAGRALATAWIATLAGCTSLGPAPGQGTVSQPPSTQPRVSLSRNDVLFRERVFSVGSRYWSGMCGFTIHGNYDSGQVPRPEWTISIEELMDGDTPVVRVRAARFEVMSKEGNHARKPSAPITALTFAREGEREPLIGHIVGPPSRTNAITATLETAAGQRLLEAFYDARPVTISLTYQDGATEALEVRNWSDLRQFTGLNGYLHQCLEHLNPVPPGAREVTYTLVSPGRAYGFGFEAPNSDTAPWD